MVIRLATKNDIEIIVKLRLKMLQDYEENLPQELSGAIQNYLEKHINDNSCICSLAEIDGTIVSMAMLCGYEEIPDEMVETIEDLAYTFAKHASNDPNFPDIDSWLEQFDFTAMADSA